MKHFLLIIIILISGCKKYNNINNTKHLSKINIPQEDCIPNIPCNKFFESHVKATNSLWQPGSKTFFKDNRAWMIGDIVKVIVVIKDSAKLNAANSQSSNFNMSAGLKAQFPKNSLNKNNISIAPLLDLLSKYKNNNAGSIDRKETITTQISAHVTQLLHNGNIVLSGHQEILVDSELRNITIKGIIRPKDITKNNSINLDQMAEARISYGGSSLK